MGTLMKFGGPGCLHLFVNGSEATVECCIYLYYDVNSDTGIWTHPWERSWLVSTPLSLHTQILSEAVHCHCHLLHGAAPLSDSSCPPEFTFQLHAALYLPFTLCCAIPDLFLGRGQRWGLHFACLLLVPPSILHWCSGARCGSSTLHHCVPVPLALSMCPAHWVVRSFGRVPIPAVLTLHQGWVQGPFWFTLTLRVCLIKAQYYILFQSWVTYHARPCQVGHSDWIQGPTF